MRRLPANDAAQRNEPVEPAGRSGPSIARAAKPIEAGISNAPGTENRSYVAPAASSAAVAPSNSASAISS